MNTTPGKNKANRQGEGGGGGGIGERKEPSKKLVSLTTCILHECAGKRILSSSADGILTRSQRPLVRDIIVNEKINLYPLFLIQINALILLAIDLNILKSERRKDLGYTNKTV